jgi:hypothetical protein
VPVDFDGAYRIANVVHRAGMAPASLDSLEKVMVAILHGLEVGLTPMNALQSIAVINGRPTIWGDGAVGLIRASGLLEYMKEYYEHEDTPEMKAVCVVKRRGETYPVTTTFSLLDARKADLLGKKGPWQTYPKRMLKMRARWALRDTFADVLKGLHLREEVDDYMRSQEPDEPVKTTVEDILADLPDPAAEPAKVEEKAAPVEAVKEDPISSGPFPGDTPMKKVEEPVNDLPWRLDRKLSDNDREWLLELDEEFSRVDDLESIASVDESIMEPAKDTVSPYVWKKAIDLMGIHTARVRK